MKRFLITLSTFALAVAVVGCTKDEDPVDPDPPTVGAQIDRVGRPGVSSALIGAFLPSGAAKDQLKDDYNAASTATNDSVAEIMANLAILDSLNVDVGGTDVSICGDQILADAATPRYGTLATVVNDDRLWINSADTQSCVTEVQAFLAVEAGATGLIAGAETLCGGRLPTQDVIATLYTAFVSDLTTPYDDTVLEDPDGVPSDDNFPFLNAP